MFWETLMFRENIGNSEVAKYGEEMHNRKQCGKQGICH